MLAYESSVIPQEGQTPNSQSVAVSSVKAVGQMQPYIILFLEEALIALEYTENATLLRKNIRSL